MMFIKLGAILFLLELSVGQVENQEWDLAVVVQNQIKLLHKNGTNIEAATSDFEKPKAITYDNNRKQFLVSDTRHDRDAIYALQITKETDIIPLIKDLPDDIQGITIDPVEDKLYWTDSVNRSIKSISLKGDEKATEVFLNFEDEKPQDILIDSCNRKLFWSNSNMKKPTIESSTLDRQNHTVLVDEDIFMPIGIAIDHYKQRIYWADVRQGIYFRIESITLEGNDRRVLYDGTHQKPFGLIVDGDYVYWSDRSNEAIWKKNKLDSSEPIKITHFNDEPLGLVSRNLGFLGVPDCSEIEVLEKPPDAIRPLVVNNKERKCNECLNDGHQTEDCNCICPPGYIGDRCQIDSCYNLCVHGKCLPTTTVPQCQCFSGHTGSRCEISTCDNFCLNSGLCDIISGVALCDCKHGFSGNRCEISSHDYNLTQSERLSESILEEARSIRLEGSGNRFEDPFFICLVSFVGLQSVIIITLSVLYSKKQRRPRIKKRIVVNKNITPLTYTPQHPPTAQCEITIENCCNMNVCETPCFEPPSIRTFSGSEKDEKKMLLVNMENEDLY